MRYPVFQIKKFKIGKEIGNQHHFHKPISSYRNASLSSENGVYKGKLMSEQRVNLFQNKKFKMEQ